ncbi:MAG: hypothetical protein ACRCU5_17285 [Rhizobiaceae bacterium]
MNLRVLLRFMMAWLAMAVGLSNSLAQDDQAAVDAFLTMTKNTVLSCDTLVVLDYPKSDDPESLYAAEKPIVAPVDLSECQKKLKPVRFDKPLVPFFQMMSDYSTTGSALGLSDSERETRRKKFDEMMVRVPQQVKTGLNPFVDYCRSLKPKVASDKRRICYFGAFSDQTKAPAVAAFSAMANGTIKSEALCSAEPMNKKTIKDPEFQSFVSATENALSWTDIRQSLIGDGFSCSDANGRDSCERWVLSIQLDIKEYYRGQSEWPKGIYETDFIVPRQLNIYRGKWFLPGPPNRAQICNYNKVKKESNCKPMQPKRGTDSGICMAPEDWHVFYGVPMLINGMIK